MTAVKRPAPVTDEDAHAEQHDAAADPAYFESYADLRVHEDMLRDYARTDAYRRAIEAARLEGLVVLDVGGGTGILSLFAAREGKAKHVYCVEASEIATTAEQTMRANGVEDVVTVIRGKIEDVTLPEKVDVIVSEWMGFCLLFESMLDSVIVARDRWLKPGGRMLPERANLYLALLGNDMFYENRVRFWDDHVKEMYKVDLSFLGHRQRTAQPKEVVLDHVSPECVLSQPSRVAQLDLMTINISDLQRIHHKFELSSMVSSSLHGLVVWFDVEFPGGLCLTTSPYESHVEAHPPLVLLQDQVVSGMIVFSRPPNGRRNLDIFISTSHTGADTCPSCSHPHKFTLSPDLSGTPF